MAGTTIPSGTKGAIPSIAIAALSAVIGAAAGSLGATMLRGGADVDALKKSAYQQGYEKARYDINEIFVQKGESRRLDQPVTFLFGTVKSVGAGSFVIEYDAAQFTALDIGAKTKTVRVGDGTSLKKMVDVKPGEKSDAGVPTASASSGFGPDSVPPSQRKGANAEPMPQKGVPIALADLKAGDYVQVFSATDVKSANVIEATGVTVLDVKPAEGQPAVDPSLLPKAMDISAVGAPPPDSAPSSASRDSAMRIPVFPPGSPEVSKPPMPK